MKVSIKLYKAVVNKDNPSNSKENNSRERRLLLYLLLFCRTNNTKHQRRMDKVQFSMYCSAKVSKIVRHFLDMHEKEIEVPQILAIEIKDEESGEIIKKKRQERRRLFN